MNVDHRIEKLDELLSDVSRRRRALLRLSPRPGWAELRLAGWSTLENRFRLVLSTVEQELGARDIVPRSD